MSYIPDSSLLQGLSLDVAECFGKPHINAWYTQNSANVKLYKFEYGSNCPICGKRATNVHHCPPRSKGKFILHGHVLRPALFALCGSGTTGCHGMIHNRQIVPKWEWYSDEYAEYWWSGELLEKLGAHSDLLYTLGTWNFKKI